MKKFTFILLAMVATLPFLNSCNSDAPDNWTHGEFVTVRVSMGTNVYFERDNGETIYPERIDRLPGKYDGTTKNNCRAVIYYSLIEKPATDTDLPYDFYADIFAIGDLATSDIKTVESAESADSQFGALPVEVYGYEDLNETNSPYIINIIGEYLQFTPAVKVKEFKNSKISLVENKFATIPAEADGYTYLELRHANADGVDKSQVYKGTLSAFRLGNLNPKDSGSKGFYIKFTNMEEVSKHVIVKYTKPAN